MERPFIISLRTIRSTNQCTHYEHTYYKNSKTWSNKDSVYYFSPFFHFLSTKQNKEFRSLSTIVPTHVAKNNENKYNFYAITRLQTIIPPIDFTPILFTTGTINVLFYLYLYLE